MKWINKIHRVAAMFLSAGLVAASVWGVSAAKPQAAAAAPASAACGNGDHGLLQSLQAKHQSLSGAPLSFSDIQFLNADTGRAAGDGFLIGTSDGGCRFQEIYQGAWNFKQMDFPDNVHGWALASVQNGAADYLIATVDGGSTWKRLSDKAATFERIDFTDTKHGFGYNRNSTYYTEDGGVSWSKIPTPANTRGAEFSSRDTGWAVVVAPGSGYRIMRTTNGGSSWTLVLKSAFAYPESGRVYAKGNQVYALLYGGTGMNQTSYSLYASSNQGKRWSRVIAEDSAGGGPAPGSGPAQLTVGPASGKPGNMQLVGSGTAFLFGYSPAGEQVAVGRTYASGKQWSNQPPVPGYDGVISFPTAKSGWMAVKELNTSSLYATEDGGTTWKQKFSFKPMK